MPVPRTRWIKIVLVFGLGFPGLAGAQSADDVAPPKLAGAMLVLTAAHSTGGSFVQNKDGSPAGVTLDKASAANLAKRSDACIEWKLAEPIPAGWWRGVLESNAPAGWANREFSVVFASGQKPGVMVKPNYTGDDKGGDPRRFSFWIHASAPTSAVRIQPKGDLWYYNKTWPVSRLTLVHEAPAALAETDAFTLDLAAKPDGAIVLPMPLPAGVWSVTGVLLKDGELFFTSDDGRTGAFPLSRDRWKRPRTGFFYMDSPLRGLKVAPADSFQGTVLLRHDIKRAYASMATDTPLLTTADYQRTETGMLELIGAGLAGEAPSFATFPHGKKIAVLTSWDDGKPEDLRTAEILNKLGYRPTFFMNRGSDAMKYLDKLAALNGEIGSHSASHPALNAVSPQAAFEECAEMRKLLEQKLGHPVISFAYPNGYSPGYDLEGDYVLRAVEKSGYWSARTTGGRSGTVDAITRPLMLGNDGFIGNRMDLERTWAEVKDKEGSVFHFWGHSWQLDRTEKGWADFEQFTGRFANQPHAWYASQGELSLWLWSRRQVKLTVSKKEAGRVGVSVTRPWLHPWLAERAVLSFKVPAGVRRAVWQGKEQPVKDGLVEFIW